MLWILDRSRFRVVSIKHTLFLLLLFNLFSCREEPEQISQIKNDESICELANIGGSYIIGYLGAQGLTIFSANQITKRADEIVKAAEATDDIKTTIKKLIGVKEPFDAKTMTSNFLMSNTGKGVLNVFRSIPYLGPLFDIFNIFRGFGSIGCNPSLAIKKFVTDSIIKAHNQNLIRIWQNAEQDARDELKDIEVTNENLLTSLEITLNSFRYAQDERTETLLLVQDMDNSFENKFSPVGTSLTSFAQRMVEDEQGKWVVASSAAFAKLVQLSLHQMKAHLTAARGIDMSFLESIDEVQAAALKGSTGHAYKSYLELVTYLEPTITQFAAKFSQADRFEVEFKCDDPCYEVIDSEWKVKLYGTFVIKLHGEEIISFAQSSGHEVHVIDLVKWFPEEHQSALPSSVKEVCGGIRGTPTCRPRSLDEDVSWPGKVVETDTGLRGRGGVKFIKREYHPHNKYLGMGRDGFWNYAFHELKIQNRYIAEVDPEIAAITKDLETMFEKGREELQNLATAMESIKKNTESCQFDDSYESLIACQYFADPAMEAIKEAVQVARQ